VVRAAWLVRLVSSDVVYNTLEATVSTLGTGVWTCRLNAP